MIEQKLIQRIVLASTAAATLAVSASAAVAATQVAPGPAYHVEKRYTVGGEGGWDYLLCDAASRRLYLSRGSHVMVVNVDNGKVVGDIADTPGVHGVALAPKLGRGFTSNGGDSTVTVFDLKTLKPIKRVHVGDRPDAIFFDPNTNRVFTCNGGSADTTAIDANTLIVAGTVPLGGRPEAGASDGRGHVFINIEDRSEVARIDAKSLKLLNHWSLSPGEEPSGFAIDIAHHRIFSTCHNSMMVVLDSETGKVVATPAIGDGTDASGFDPATGLAFSSNGDGTLTVIKEVDANHFAVQENVQTERGARTMALDLKTHAVYLATAKSDPTPPAPDAPRRFRRYLPGSFAVLVVSRSRG